jgi:hypothetical protein
MRGWRVRSRSAWGTWIRPLVALAPASVPEDSVPALRCLSLASGPSVSSAVTHVLGLRGNAGDVHSDSAPRARDGSSVHQSGAPARDVPGTVHVPSRYAGYGAGPGGGRARRGTPRVHDARDLSRAVSQLRARRSPRTRQNSHGNHGGLDAMMMVLDFIAFRAFKDLFSRT